MSHNIYNEKFLSVRKPAWHNLGLVIDDEIGAVEAGERIGLPIVYTEQIQTRSGLVIPGYKAIVGKDRNTVTPYSVVTEDYNEIRHADFLVAWDEATGHASIETIGLLGKGENLFVTTRLPKFDVKGDELDNYLLAANILSGRESDFGRITPVRVVCQNTLNLSARQFSEEFRVVHRGDSIKQIKTWLETVWKTAHAKIEAVKEAYQILADFTPNGVQVISTLLSTYQSPARPETDPRDDLDAWRDWEVANKRQIVHRDSVLELFEGKATGSDLRAARGTGWGLWNAVVEYEDYVKPRRAASSALFGAGADRKQAAFDSLLKLATL